MVGSGAAMLKLVLVGGVPPEWPAAPLHPLQQRTTSSKVSPLPAILQCVECRVTSVEALGNHDKMQDERTAVDQDAVAVSVETRKFGSPSRCVSC